MRQAVTSQFAHISLRYEGDRWGALTAPRTSPPAAVKRNAKQDEPSPASHSPSGTGRIRAKDGTALHFVTNGIERTERIYRCINTRVDTSHYLSVRSTVDERAAKPSASCPPFHDRGIDPGGATVCTETAVPACAAFCCLATTAAHVTDTTTATHVADTTAAACTSTATLAATTASAADG